MLAIIVTIMVLSLQEPNGTSWAALRSVVPDLLTYAVSFLYVGIYWNNHHHLLKACHRVTAPIMWANLFLLQTVIVTGEGGPNSPLGKTLGRDHPKGILTLGLTALAMALSFVAPWASVTFFLTVTVICLIPDRRISGLITASESGD